MKKHLFYYLLLILGLSCTNETSPDCSLVLCAANDAISLELLVNGENVIANGTYTEENITVTSTPQDNLKVQVFPNTQGTTEGLLEISSFEWERGTYLFTIVLDGDYEFNLEVVFGVTTYPCCGDRLEIRELSSIDAFIAHETYSSFYTVVLN